MRLKGIPNPMAHLRSLATMCWPDFPPIPLNVLLGLSLGGLDSWQAIPKSSSVICCTVGHCSPGQGPLMSGSCSQAFTCSHLNGLICLSQAFLVLSSSQCRAQPGTHTGTATFQGWHFILLLWFKLTPLSLTWQQLLIHTAFLHTYLSTWASLCPILPDLSWCMVGTGWALLSGTSESRGF